MLKEMNIIMGLPKRSQIFIYTYIMRTLRQEIKTISHFFIFLQDGTTRNLRSSYLSILHASNWRANRKTTAEKLSNSCLSIFQTFKEGIKKSEEENDDTEISSNFPIRDKLKPLYKGKLILEKNKELEGLSIEKLCVEKFYHANISMN